jgi:two-component system OmpR family response regulator
MKILIIEDEREIADFVTRGLEAERFVVDRAPTGAEGVEWAKANRYDLAIIDVNLGKKESGLDVCAELREAGETFPIIMLSVTSDAATKVQALNLGADDYLTKPFFIVELLARIRALLRREKKIIGPKLILADVVVDTLAHTATRAGKLLVLNRKEFTLLEYLMRNLGTTLTRSMILEHVWDMNADPFTNTVDVHISFLRAKIDSGRRDRDKLIKTVYGYGYKMERGE